MKSAAVMTVDEAFAFFISAVGYGSSQVSPPPGICHPIEKNANAMPGVSPGWGGGRGVLGGVGSPKNDWCIINLLALLLIQALVEDQVHHPSDTGVQANCDHWFITRTIKNLSTHPTNLIITCLLHPRGEEAEPLVLFWGFFAKIFFFVTWSLSHIICHLLFLLAVTTAFIISVLLSELLPTVLL